MNVMANSVLIQREQRERYRLKRREQLKRVTNLKNVMAEEDLELFNNFKPMRTRANVIL